MASQTKSANRFLESLRIVYRVDGTKIEVFVIAVGLRRDDEIYDLALKRLQ
jgi:mRNA-degrading endonuclease RelE of RelBE toxin-antitoxin system